ncbi:MAG: hypothetical protein IJL52_10410 [Clostridia bacterium]|nr:hypothetical protein [Clostridia bacterium]
MDKEKASRLLGGLFALATGGLFGTSYALKVTADRPYIGHDDKYDSLIPVLIAIGIVCACITLVCSVLNRVWQSPEQREKSRRISAELSIFLSACAMMLGGYFYFVSQTEQNVTFKYSSKYEELASFNTIGLILMIASVIALVIIVAIKIGRKHFDCYGSILSGLLTAGFGVFALSSESKDDLWDYVSRESEMMHRFGIILLADGIVMIGLGILFYSMKRKEQEQNERMQWNRPNNNRATDQAPQHAAAYPTPNSEPEVLSNMDDSSTHNETTFERTETVTGISQPVTERKAAAADSQQTVQTDQPKPSEVPSRFDYCPFCGARAIKGGSYCAACGRQFPL